MAASTVKVMAEDMDDEMLQFAIQTISQAFDACKLEKDVANMIKEQFDSKYQYTWNCAVGRDFGSHVVHQTKRYLFASFQDNFYILLWKSN